MFNRKTLKKFEKPIACLSAGLFFALALCHFAFAGLLAPRARTASAADSSYTAETISIPNGDFTNSSGSFPKSPSDWTGESLQGNSGKLYAGVISLNPSQYAANSEIYHNMFPDASYNDFRDLVDTYSDAFETEGDTDRGVLMINTLDGSGAYAFTSQSVAVEAYRRAEFSVWVKTFGYDSSGKAVVALLDADSNKPVGELKDKTVSLRDQNRLLIDNIDTNAERKDWNTDNGWREYSFIVETSYYPVNFKLSLQSGTDGSAATGAAFFKGAAAKTLSVSEHREMAADAGPASPARAHSFIPRNAGDEGYADRVILDGSDNTDPSVNLAVNADQESEDGAAVSIDPYFNGADTVYEAGRPNQNPDGSWEVIRGGAGEDGDPNSDNIVKTGNAPEVVAAGLNPDGSYTFNDMYAPFAPADQFPGGGSGVNLLQFYQSDAGAVGARSKNITIERYRYYRLSVWYRTDEEGKATLALTEPADANGVKRAVLGEKQSALTTAGKTGLPHMENWNQASFFIKGSSDETRYINLELWLGYGGKNAADTHSAGAAYFYGVELETMSPADFTARSEGKTVVTLTADSSSSTVTNGTFRDYTYDTFEFPLQANGWTYFEGNDAGVLPYARDFAYKDEAVERGILPTDNGYYTKTAGLAPQTAWYAALLPSGGVTTQPKNALMILNNDKSAAGYTSSAITVSASTYAKISVLASHEADPRDGDAHGAALVLKRNGKIAAEILDIKTDGQWREYAFFVAAGDEELSLELLLMNGQPGIDGRTAGSPFATADSPFTETRLSKGAAFFANAEMATVEEDAYKTAGSNAARNRQVDFKSDFGLFGYNEKSALKPSYSFTGVAGAVKGGLPQINSSRAGVLDTKNILPEDAYLLPKEKDETGALAKNENGNTVFVNPGTSQGDDARYVLMIDNTAPTGFKLVSDKEYTLSASSYYRVSVSVKTYGVPADEGQSRYGATAALKGVEGAYFNGIRTEGANASNEYKTYSFYILTGSNSLPFNFELGLGDPLKESTWSTGWAFYDRIEVATINKTEYDAMTKRIKDEEPADRISLSFADATAAADEEAVKAKSFWDWYWLPSLLFALAILAVLVNNLFRRVVPAIARRRKPRAARAPSYARRPDAAKADRGATSYADDETYIDIDTTKNYVYGDDESDIAAEPDEAEPYPDGGTAQAETAATADIGDAPDAAETETAATTDGNKPDTSETVPAPAEKPAPAKIEPKKREKPAAAKAAKAKPEKERAGDYTDYFED
ncbi:MAG: hypothetical protein LBL66_02240 [Clostridiales bacterium]|jgi:hypothetical protein|nr:hypothetical protein [Clostridiales bacterium]